MTSEQLSREMLYQASLSPFKALLNERGITKREYQTIDAMLRAQYSPIFVGNDCFESLDN